MNYRLFLSIMCFSCAVAVAANATVTEYSFGPKIGSHLVVVIPSSTEQNELIAAIRDHFGKNSPAAWITLFVTDDDSAAVRSIADEKATAVVFLPGTGGRTVICNGARGKTTPPWLLKKITETLADNKTEWTLAEYRMPLYRLGWTDENPHLAAWLNEGISAIQVETSNAALGIGMIDRLSAHLAKNIPEANDSHYLIFRFRGEYHIVSETFIVAALIVASAVILFFLFIFSFLFGKKSDQHLRDLLRVWWVPFIFLAIDIAALYAGQLLVMGLIQFRFGNAEAWSLIPSLAFISKIAVSWFFVTMVVSLNQLIRFPDDSFIYGYIAAIICFVNIFVFASLDFSYSALFLSVYIIAFVTYHIRHPASQVLGLIALAVPFVPYLIALFAGDSARTAASLAPLYSGSQFWNVRIALLAMPFQLFMSGLFQTFGLFGRRHRFYLPINLFAIFIIAISAGGVLLFVPAWSNDQPLKIKIIQTIDGNGSHIATNSVVRLPDLTIRSDHGLASAPGLDAKAEKLMGVNISSQKFLERQLVSVTVSPVIPYDSIELDISGGAGIPVHDASEPFELRNTGAVCAFVPEVNPGKEWTITFSSSLASSLTATVTLHTHENPWGLVIEEKDIAPEYLLEVTRTIAIPVPGTETP